MVEQKAEEDLSSILKAASDPTRRKILAILAQNGPTRVTDLAKHFDVSLNSVSKHIKVLERGALVTRRTEWRAHIIELDLSRLQLVDQWFAALRSIWDIRLEALDTLLTKETPNDGPNTHS